jgi:hypothetical protein
MRLLVSARDPGAALSIFEVIKQIKYFQQITLSVFAMEPALGILQGLGVQVKKVDCKPATSGNSENSLHLQREATSILAKNKPDALLVGLSGPDAGIDEALLLQARKSRLPTYAIQDFWGDVNLTFEQPADTYFVIDNSAREMTRKRVDSEAIVVGSLKHSNYPATDIKSLRSEFQEKSSCQAGRHIITFCGQPLWHLDSYQETLEKLADIASETADETTLIYSHHPKETRTEASSALNILKNRHDNSILNESFSNESLFARSDIVCSCFSLACFDQVIMNRLSPIPLGIAAFIFLDKALLNWYKTFTKHDRPMPGMESFSDIVLSPEDLKTSIENSKIDSYKTKRWEQIMEEITAPQDSSKVVLNYILNNSLKQK